MTRFFYKDPLAAAWMAKHFGMRFYFRYEDGQEIALRGIGNMLAYESGGLGEASFYIHPESLHLLKARDGDTLYGPCGGELFAVSEHCHFRQEMSVEDAQESIDNADWQLIQRWVWREGENSGPMAFMWPESEAA